jgi:hypothetical protein
MRISCKKSLKRKNEHLIFIFFLRNREQNGISLKFELNCTPRLCWVSLEIQPKNHLTQGCQMVCFQTKNTNLGKFSRALDWKKLIYFIAICNFLWRFEIFLTIWYILYSFGTFFRFWYRVPRKIWQPCSNDAGNGNRLRDDFPTDQHKS